MPLESALDLVHRARAGGYAIGYFESWSIDSLQGVIDAAEANASPVIIGFSGEFLTGPDRLSREPLSWYAALGKAAAESAKVPCGLIFNECPRDAKVIEAVDAGFNLVMPADPEADYADYRRRVTEIVRYAHVRGAAVEAELGELPSGASGEIVAHGGMTDIAQAADFVAATGVDLLAVSVGNVHILLHGAKALDLAHLDALHQRLPIPLVLHGGTGIDAESLRGAIARGVAKVNYGTNLKRSYLRAVRVALDNTEANPHALLGIGGPEDVLVAGRRAVCAAVRERIPYLGCAGKA